MEAVLIETANVTAGTTLSDLMRPVQARQVAKALVTNDAEVHGTWATSNDETVPLALKVARLPPDVSSPVVVELAIGDDASQKLSVETRDQQPVVVQVGDGRAVAITPYFLVAPKAEGLRAFARCVRLDYSARDSGEHPQRRSTPPRAEPDGR